MKRLPLSSVLLEIFCSELSLASPRRGRCLSQFERNNRLVAGTCLFRNQRRQRERTFDLSIVLGSCGVSGLALGRITRRKTEIAHHNIPRLFLYLPRPT